MLGGEMRVFEECLKLKPLKEVRIEAIVEETLMDEKKLEEHLADLFYL